MKFVSKIDITVLACALLLVILVVIITDPTPLVEWRAKHRAASLRNGVRGADNSTIKFFLDLKKLNKRGHYFIAEKIFYNAFAQLPEESRLTRPQAIEALMTISVEMLRALPQNSIYITETDNETFPLMFLQIVQDIRYDVVVINRHLWRLPEYRKFLWKNTPLKNALSEDELFPSPDKIDSDRTTNLSAIAHKLAKYYPIFVSTRGTAEFPSDSLYFIPPAMAKMYSPRHLSDTLIAMMSFKMMRNQNLNYLAENPPTASIDEYKKCFGKEINTAVSNTIVMLHETGKDSLAQYIFKKYDPWMRWNLDYNSSRKIFKKFFPQPQKKSSKEQKAKAIKKSGKKFIIKRK